MKLSHLAITVLCSLGLTVTSQAAAPRSHDDHAAHATPAPAPVPAKRWATDAPLRAGMSRVHSALDQLRQYETGRMTASMALQHVAMIEEATRYMFANCKLPAAADAALHGMLARLLAGATALKNDPDDKTAVAAMRDAVADYPRYFDDPHWPPSRVDG